jgi:hypothetical protein
MAHEIIITLHTEAGDVVTAYPMRMILLAQENIVAYLQDNKKFSVHYE